MQNLDKLAYGRIDAAIIDKYVAADLMATRHPYFIGKLEISHPGPVLEPLPPGLPAQTGPPHRTLRQAFNDGLKALEKDGGLVRILSRHSLAAPSPPSGDARG